MLVHDMSYPVGTAATPMYQETLHELTLRPTLGWPEKAVSRAVLPRPEVALDITD